MKRRIGCLSTILILVAAPYLAWKAFEYSFQLNLLPPELGVWWISESVTESSGFGPGCNETGIIVYALPEAVAKRIEAEGLQFFSQGWPATPVETGALSLAELSRNELVTAAHTRRLEAYLDRYGFGISVPAWISRLANDAIASPDNFYSYSRGGAVMIVIPQERRVVLAFAG